MNTNIKYNKIRYIGLAVVTILLGLASRKIAFVPATMGDLLYAVMVYWLCRFLFFNQSNLFSLRIALTFCFFIECLQLVQTPFFIYIRNNPILRLVFGQGFLCSDLLAYAAGAFIALLLDKSIFLTYRTQRK